MKFLLGPAVVGLAVWCASGEITVVTADTAMGRLAVGAAWWIAAAAAAVAFLVPAWRRTPVLALPAVLSTLPWWPVPLPSIALLWTGPLAWAPIAAACALARPGAAPALRRFASTRGALAAALATFVACGLTAWSATRQSPQGDEPHYLVTTQSLIQDGDLRVENNYRQRDYAAYYPGQLTPDFDRRGKDGEIYSIHPIGVSIVVLPAFALFGYRGAEMTLLLFAAMTGALVWRIGFAATGDRTAAWFGWAVAILTPAFLLHSFAMFPESLGACAFSGAALLLVRLVRADQSNGTGAIVAASAAIAALPWLHSRFAILAAAFGVLIAAHLLLESGRPIAMRVRRAAAFLALPAASAAGWLASFYAIYGTADPRGAHGIIEFSALRVARGVLGILFDQQYGFLAFTPALVCAGIALAGASAPHVRRLCWYFAGAALFYLAAVVGYRMDEMWWAGLPSAPARYGVAIVPAFALPCAAVWLRADRIARRLWATLLLAGLACSLLLVTVERGAIAWNWRDAQARWLEWLAPVVNLPRGWPSYFWPFPSLTPFVIHVALFVALPAAFWLLIRAAGTRRRWSDRSWRLACACWAAVSLSGIVQVGWWMNSTNGLDPTRSQLRVLASSSASGQLRGVAPFRVERNPDLNRMRIRREEAKRYDPRPVLARFSGVPPGRYQLRLQLSAPAGGTITIRLNGTIRAVLEPASSTRPVLMLDLSDAGGVLDLLTDAQFDGDVLRVELVPVLATSS